jgi:hypothetical protein
VHLIPIYDEYVVAYRDRVAVPHGALFRHFVVASGHVAGEWQPGTDGDVRSALSRKLTRDEQRAFDRAVERYRQFRKP